MNKDIIFSHKFSLFAVFLVFLSSGSVLFAAADDTFDDSIVVARSNVVQSQVDPSFWEEREPLTISTVEKPLVLPTHGENPIAVCSSPGNSTEPELTPENHATLGKAQELALILINIPDYQAGEPVFKLDDKTQVQLSSMKYTATGEYYGRTDLSSSWVTDFYNAAYCDNYQNLFFLLEELPAEV